MYHTKNQVISFFFCTKCCDSCEKKKYENEIWNNVLSAGANNFSDFSYLLIIQFTSFLVEDLVSNHGQQFVFQMDDNLFSRCYGAVTSGKVQGSEVCLDVSRLSAAATR